ncbi:hypothetical protein [Streptomyces sp. NBC_00328]|uniref:hypothetical protein n=1 Tax=Streptomyces sp. NBC_00328 TaxID=2903646 RepID=UPI002E28E1CD|nr:hypothetical protein [Streptomyces sp. NBC_00328]
MEWSVGTITNHAQRLGLSFGEDKPLKQDDHSVDALRYTIKTTQHIWRPHVALNFEEVA